jgi:hypothetical protein
MRAGLRELLLAAVEFVSNRAVVGQTSNVMTEVLTIEQIQARYSPDWVLIGEPQIDEALNVRAGKVLFHSPDHDEVCRKAMAYPDGRYALRFLGTIPEDLVLVL